MTEFEQNAMYLLPESVITARQTGDQEEKTNNIKSIWFEYIFFLNFYSNSSKWDSNNIMTTTAAAAAVTENNKRFARFAFVRIHKKKLKEKRISTVQKEKYCLNGKLIKFTARLVFKRYTLYTYIRIQVM